MKNTKSLLHIILALALMLPIASCDKDDDDDAAANGKNFKSLTSPYLICSNRNPGGVGFDFEYNSKTGGANNMDSLSVDDFKEDILLKTIKSDNNGTAAAVNYIALHNGAQAVNYSSINTECKGITNFKTLSYATVSAQTVTLTGDGADFSLVGLTTGNSCSPLMTEVNAQVAKLVIGDKWKASAKNNIAEDELIWIIKTHEGRWVKFIVTEFPAKNAPTANGYINIEWDYLN